MGTSLMVHPFAALAGMVPADCPRVLVNLDHVGDFGTRSDDVLCLGKTDEVVRDLCKELGWEEELDAAWKETENSVVDFEPQTSAAKEERSVEDEVDALTEAVGKTLHIEEVLTDKSKEEAHKDKLDEPKAESKADGPIKVEVGHANSTKPKTTYIIGDTGVNTESEENDTKEVDDQKVVEQKL